MHASYSSWSSCFSLPCSPCSCSGLSWRTFSYWGNQLWDDQIPHNHSVSFIPSSLMKIFFSYSQSPSTLWVSLIFSQRGPFLNHQCLSLSSLPHHHLALLCSSCFWLMKHWMLCSSPPPFISMKIRYWQHSSTKKWFGTPKSNISSKW